MQYATRFYVNFRLPNLLNQLYRYGWLIFILLRIVILTLPRFLVSTSSSPLT